jgi:DUF438 domain-containing protein
MEGGMIDQTTVAAIVHSLKDPLMFVDTSHIIRYMNKAAIEHFDDGAALLGRSLMDCHNEKSQETIRETLVAFEAGEDERLISDKEDRRIYMRVVRNADGRVLGYYERYEPCSPP